MILYLGLLYHLAKMQRDLQECWHSAQRCLTWMFRAIRSEIKKQGVLPQCPAVSGKKNEREIVYHSLSEEKVCDKGL